jgi:hypothetical protein
VCRKSLTVTCNVPVALVQISLPRTKQETPNDIIKFNVNSIKHVQWRCRSIGF